MKLNIEKLNPEDIRDASKCYKVYIHTGSVMTGLEAITLSELLKMKADLDVAVEKIMKSEADNKVASYIFYMYNAWSKEECFECFKDNPVCPASHLWNKYVEISETYGCDAAPMRFFVELNNELQDILYRRAIMKYYRRRKIC